MCSLHQTFMPINRVDAEMDKGIIQTPNDMI